MASDDEGGNKDCDTLCIIVEKFLLFTVNFLVWIIGCGLLALGIYIEIDDSSTTLQEALISISNLLANPAISLIVIGAVLFVIGFCGCFGALLELTTLLVLYSILVGLIILGEIALVVYIYVVQDEAYSAFELIIYRYIEEYYNDINVRDVINLIQRDLLRCCGASGPDDWQANIYFNCSSVAFQRCSVPASCCIVEEGEIINLQCGYRTLSPTEGRHLKDIYTNGCVDQARQFVNSNGSVILGVGAGLLLFQILGFIISVSLAVTISRRKAIAKAEAKQRNLNYASN